MAAVSVMYNPSYALGYDVDNMFLNELPVIASRMISSYKDASSNVQDLTLGATSNVNIESLNDTNIYVYDGSAVNIYETSVTENVRTDTKILSIYNSNSAYTVISPDLDTSNAIMLKPTDGQSTVTTGSMTINNAAGYQVLSTTQINGFRLTSPVNVLSSIIATGDIVTQSDFKASGHLFGQSMNLYKNMTESNVTNQIAYGFYINEYNQLELLRYYKYASSNETPSSQEKVMTFGTAIFNENGHKQVPFSAASNYKRMDVFNGIISESNAGGSILPGSGNAGSSPFFVNPIGNVYLPEGTYLGLGTSNPAYTLDVQGTISSTNVIVSPQFLSSSDQRLKENIKLISDVSACLDTLKKLNIYNYNFRLDEDKRLRTGFIAQEVKRQIPNAVIQTEFAGLSDCMQIDTDVLIAYLVGAVKSLSTKVDYLSSKVSV